MGEYALFNGNKIKIGTCELMFLLRYEDAGRIKPLPGNINPYHNPEGLFFRLPFPDEDDIHPGAYKNYNRGALLHSDFDPGEIEEGIIQLHHPCGLLLNISCYHGKKLPEIGEGIKAFWNGKYTNWWELCFVKVTEEGFRPVYRCRACGKMFSTDEWEMILECLLDRNLAERIKKRYGQYFPKNRCMETTQRKDGEA